MHKNKANAKIIVQNIRGADNMLKAVLSRKNIAENAEFYGCISDLFDARAGARAGLLHDFYFYNHHRKNESVKGIHFCAHPMIAFANAAELFPISELESDMIVCHMWPITAFFPRHRETFVITFVDKFCAVAEIASSAVNRARKRVD